MTVLSRLPSLRFLDSSPITPQERTEAAERAKKLHRPDPSEYTKPAEVVEPSEKGLETVDTRQEEDGPIHLLLLLIIVILVIMIIYFVLLVLFTHLVSTDIISPSLSLGKSVAFGQSKYVYYGRHSEGNRFIEHFNFWGHGQSENCFMTLKTHSFQTELFRLLGASFSHGVYSIFLWQGYHEQTCP